MVAAPGLSSRQLDLLDQWLPGAELLADHSWGLVATTVLELTGPTGHVIVKAGGADDHHIAREICAHRQWMAPWTASGHAPRLLAADESAKLLMTRYLPGGLVEGDPVQDDPDTYRQAGTLLARFHSQHAETVDGWNEKLAARTLRWFDSPHRIQPQFVRELRDEIAGWPTDQAVTVVPTHGDWQPRNWLIDEGTVRVIDLGRADLRPPVEDLARLARQDFERDPRLEAAFLEGYGSDPREPGLWRRTLVAEAIGTAAWAHRVGNESFEQLGLHQIEQLLRARTTSSCRAGNSDF